MCEVVQGGLRWRGTGDRAPKGLEVSFGSDGHVYSLEYGNAFPGVHVSKH
jgi:hypothetical protein